VKVCPAIESVPERGPPPVDAAVNRTVPFPDPLAPEVMVSQLALLEAVHAHPAPLVTSTLPLPPDADTDVLVGEIEKSHPLPWLTVKVWPATVSVPERAPPSVDAVVNRTVPLPLPLAPDVTVIHETLLVAVQPQPAGDVTSVLPVPPLDAMFVAVEEMENEQPPPWLTVNVWPPMVAVPVREPELVAATVSLTVPSPEPLAPDATEIQLAPLVAVQEQPAPAVTVTVISPPAASTCCDCGEIAIEQPADCEIVIDVLATLIVPLRAGPPIGATEKLRPPPPLPDVVPVSVIQDESLEAVQAQPADVSTDEDPVPPCAPNECVRGSTAKLQPVPCVMLTTCPATRTPPDRGGPFVPSTTICAAPGPVSVAPCVTAAHGTLLAAVHGQPTAVETLTIVEPPPEPGA
jgi:hypothetical protein